LETRWQQRPWILVRATAAIASFEIKRIRTNIKYVDFQGGGKVDRGKRGGRTRESGIFLEYDECGEL